MAFPHWGQACILFPWSVYLRMLSSCRLGQEWTTYIATGMSENEYSQNARDRLGRYSFSLKPYLGEDNSKTALVKWVFSYILIYWGCVVPFFIFLRIFQYSLHSRCIFNCATTSGIPSFRPINFADIYKHWSITLWYFHRCMLCGRLSITIMICIMSVVVDVVLLVLLLFL